LIEAYNWGRGGSGVGRDSDFVTNKNFIFYFNVNSFSLNVVLIIIIFDFREEKYIRK